MFKFALYYTIVKENMSPLFNKKLSMPYIAGVALFSAVITFTITSFISNKKEENILKEKAEANSACSFQLKD